MTPSCKWPFLHCFFFQRLAATWHQYDDAIYSEPGFFDSLRNRIPFLRTFNLDTADGRRMAMMTMLPDWDKISDVDGGINAHVVLSEINNVVYCMSKTEFENGGGFFPRVPNGFDHCKVCVLTETSFKNNFLLFFAFIFYFTIFFYSIYVPLISFLK